VIDTREGKVLYQNYNVTEPEVFEEVCKKYNGKAQIYISAQPRGGGGGSYENVPVLTWIPIDIDAKRPNKKTEPANEEERQNALRNTATVIKELRSKGVEPSLWVDTGNGGLILTRIPEIKTKPYFYRQGDTIQNKLSDMVNHWLQNWVKPLCDDTVEVDSVGDLPRIIGVPNTVNIKSPEDNPRVRRIIYGDITKPPKPQPALWKLIEECWKNREKKATSKVPDEEGLMKVLPPYLRELYEKADANMDRSLVLTRTLLHIANLGWGKDECVEAMKYFTRRIGRDRWPASQQYDKLVAEGKIHVFKLGEFTLRLVGGNAVFFDGKGEPRLSFPATSVSGLRVKEKITKKLDLDEDVVDRAIAKFVTAKTTPSKTAEITPPKAEPRNPSELTEKALKLLKDPELLLYIIKAIKQRGLVGETKNALCSFFDILSSLTFWPINRRWSGRSGMGKTTIVMKVSSLFPPEMVKVYSGATKKTLWYDPDAVEVDEVTREINLEGKTLILLEESESQEFLDEIKPLLSHDKYVLDYVFVEKSGGKKNITRKVRARGWPAYIGITTTAELREEQQTRALLGTPDYGRDKYQAVIATDAEKAALPWSVKKTDLPEVIQMAVRLLKPYPIWIPWLPLVATQFPHDQPKSMREWRFFHSFIDAITLLYQFQLPRVKVNGEEYIAAPLTILEIALAIGRAGFEETLSKLPRDTREFADYLVENRKDGWTYRDLLKEYSKCFGGSIGRSTLRERYVKKLEEEGLLEVDDNKKPYTITLTGETLASLTDFEKSLETIRSKGKEFVLNHLGLSAEKGRTELLEIKDPDGNPISIDELINVLYTPSLADNVKKAITRSKSEEYALPKLFLKSVNDANLSGENKPKNGKSEKESPSESEEEKKGVDELFPNFPPENLLRSILTNVGGEIGKLELKYRLEKLGFSVSLEKLRRLESDGKIIVGRDTIGLGPVWADRKPGGGGND